jgi:hypothetical protein
VFFKRKGFAVNKIFSGLCWTSLVLFVLVLSGGILNSCDFCDCSKYDKKEEQNIESKANVNLGLIGPRWTYGIMIKNDSDSEIRVKVDGGDVNGYISIPAGKEKLLNSRGSGFRGVYWKSGNFEYETAKYAKPDCIVIKNGNLYTMTSMDGSKDMGGWTAVEPVDYVGQKAEIKKIK